MNASSLRKSVCSWNGVCSKGVGAQNLGVRYEYVLATAANVACVCVCVCRRERVCSQFTGYITSGEQSWHINTSTQMTDRKRNDGNKERYSARDSNGEATIHRHTCTHT